MRSEEMPDIQRTLVRESEAVKKAGGVHPYDPKRPWAQVWVYATSDKADKFGNDEFIMPATQVRLRLKTLGQVVDGDVPVGGSVETNVAKEVASSSGGRRGCGSSGAACASCCSCCRHLYYQQAWHSHLPRLPERHLHRDSQRALRSGWS